MGRETLSSIVIYFCLPRFNVLFESDLSSIHLEGINATCQNLNVQYTITHLGESAVCNEPHLQGDTKHCLMCQSVKENFAIIKIWPGLPG